MVRYLILIFLFLNNLAYSDDELEITAEQFTYDKDNTRIYGTGGVKIVDEKFKLNADKVFLNNSSIFEISKYVINIGYLNTLDIGVYLLWDMYPSYM